MEKYCDGIKHCADGSDEECKFKTNATIIPNDDCKTKPGLFFCDDTCFPLMKLCDGAIDCISGADEDKCNGTHRIYQVVSIGVNERTLNTTSFLIYWWIAVPQNLTFEYLPSIFIKGAWRNNTAWIEATEYRFNNLEPFTLYNVTVYVRIKSNRTEFTPYLYYEVATAEGGKLAIRDVSMFVAIIFGFFFPVPSEPINVSAVQINGSRVQVSWSAPLRPNGHLEGYTVYHRPQLQSQANVQTIRVSAAELSLVIESDFQGNVTYEIWVKARNRKQESMSSRLIQLTFDGTSNIDQIVGLNLLDMDESSMTLSWNKIKKAEGYVVQLVLPHPYPKIEPIKTQSTILKVPNLVNGAQYVARVSAFVKNYTGRSQSLILKRNGSPLPEVQGIETKREGDHIRISWRRVAQQKNEKFTYGIYYGTSLEELFDLPKHKTDDNTFLLKELYECQSYLIGVGIVGPVGPGPLGKNPRAVETHYSERKPPRNLSVTFDDGRKTMDITWEHSCSLSNKNHPNYIVS